MIETNGTDDRFARLAARALTGVPARLTSTVDGPPVGAGQLRPPSDTWLRRRPVESTSDDLDEPVVDGAAAAAQLGHSDVPWLPRPAARRSGGTMAGTSAPRSDRTSDDRISAPSGVPPERFTWPGTAAGATADSAAAGLRWTGPPAESEPGRVGELWRVPAGGSAVADGTPARGPAAAAPAPDRGATETTAGGRPTSANSPRASTAPATAVPTTEGGRVLPRPAQPGGPRPGPPVEPAAVRLREVRAEPSTPDSTPPVVVVIDRVDVRVVSTPAPGPRTEPGARPAAPLSLEEYLARRDGRR